jgi:hypothetical protein
MMPRPRDGETAVRITYVYGAPIDSLGLSWY